MKKTLKVLAATSLIAACGLTMAGCGGGGQESHVSTAAELVSAVQNGGEVVLDKDITLDQTLKIGKSVRLNLNGKTLTEELTWSKTEREKPNGITMIQVENGGDLTIVGNGKMKSNDVYLINVDGGTSEDRTAKVTIESGTFETQLTAVQVVHGAAEIKGGTFKLDPTNVTYGTKYMLNVIDQNRGTATISVMGGTYYGFDASKDNNGDGKYLAEGYKVSESDGNIFTVTKA